MRKVGSILFCFVPFLATMILQFVITIPVAGVYLIRMLNSANTGGINSLIENAMSFSTDQGFLVTVSFIYAAANIIIFVFWYRAILRKQGIFRRTPFSVIKSLLPAILLSFGLYFLVVYFMTLLQNLFPAWLELYSETLKNIGLDNPFSLNIGVCIMLILYTVVLGPISEELIFRGVTLSLAKKQMPFFAANIFQAALFGLLHLNPIQGFYAFIIGLVFGYIAHNRGTIKASVILHIIYNFIGMFIAALLPSSDSMPVYVHMLILAGSIIATIFGIMWYCKKSV